MFVIAIDPGNTHSGIVGLRLVGHPGDDLCDRVDITSKGKLPNDEVQEQVGAAVSAGEVDRVVIEMIQSYGMAVGKHVFETCVEIGRFIETVHQCDSAIEAELVFRKDVKIHHCMSAMASDANIVTSLVDKYGDREQHGKHSKGTNKDPGYFHGFAKDIWQAFALGSMVIEEHIDEKEQHYEQ